MDHAKWSMLHDKARSEEMDARSKAPFDPARPPLPVAINLRVMSYLFDRVEKLEEEVVSLKMERASLSKAASVASSLDAVSAPSELGKGKVAFTVKG